LKPENVQVIVDSLLDMGVNIRRLKNEKE